MRVEPSKMPHRLDCPYCGNRYPSKRILSATLLAHLVCPACSAPIKFTTGSSVLVGLVACPLAALAVLATLWLWPYLSWVSIAVVLLAAHYPSGLLWVWLGTLERDRKRKPKPLSA